jgi:1-acyl-sn-glycerol-3-phosphate acyltransferase
MDIPTILGYFPREVGFVAKKEMETWPFFGIWMRYGQCVFLDRKNPREGMKNMKEAVKKIQDGYSTVIFPEGTRSEDGSIGEFKKGSFKLASDPMVKIVPITVKGTFDIQRKGSLKMSRGKKVKLIVNKVVDPKLLSRDEIKKLNDTVRGIIEESYNRY